VRSRFPAALTTALLLLGSSAAALVGAEFAVRFAFRDVTTTSPIDSYFGLRWKAQHLRRNRWGYREREFDLEKTEGIYRIAVIGDSFAVGMGLLEEQRFTNLLEKYLNRGGGGFEVLQFASPGAEMYNHVKTLAENVLRAHPDFLLLQWYVNDFEFTDFGRPKAPRALIPREELHRKAFRVSALYCLLNHAWRSLQLSLGMAKKYEDYMWERFGDPESVDSQTAMRQLDVFISGAENAGIPVGIVLFPRPTAMLATDYPLAFLHERVLARCEDRGIPCLDLTPAYAPLAGRIEEIWLNRFDHHPGALGHRIAAEWILDAFAAHWVEGG
jgi:hypothetical protein